MMTIWLISQFPLRASRRRARERVSCRFRCHYCCWYCCYCCCHQALLSAVIFALMTLSVVLHKRGEEEKKWGEKRMNKYFTVESSNRNRYWYCLSVVDRARRARWFVWLAKVSYVQPPYTLQQSCWIWRVSLFFLFFFVLFCEWTTNVRL